MVQATYSKIGLIIDQPRELYDHCEDVRVALGGRPNGCGYRSTVEALIHTQAAKRRICDAITEEGYDPGRLVALGKHLLDQAARFRDSQETL
jgi:hypothetical protein